VARFRLCIAFVVASVCLGQIESNASHIPKSEMEQLLTQYDFLSITKEVKAVKH